jgi:hypothetical protein
MTGTRTATADTRWSKTPQSKANPLSSLKNPSRESERRRAKERTLGRNCNFAERINRQLAGEV